MKLFSKGNWVISVLLISFALLIVTSVISLLLNGSIDAILVIGLGLLTLLVIGIIALINAKKFFATLNDLFTKLLDKINALKKKVIMKSPMLNRIDILSNMQLKNSKSLNKTKSNKFVSFILKIVFFIASIVIFTIAIEYFQALALIPFNYELLATLIIVFIVLSVIEVSGEFVNTIYKGKDNTLLLSYPVRPGEVFASKLIVRFISEFKKVFNFILPLLIAFYIQRNVVYSLDLLYFVKLVYVIILIPTFIVLISAIISAFLVLIDYLCRKFAFIKIIVILGIYLTGSILVIGLVNALPVNLPLLQLWYSITSSVISFLSLMVSKTLFTNNLLYFLMGYDTGIKLLVTLGEIIVLLLVVCLVCFPFFFKLSSSSVEFSSSKVHKTKMKQTNNIFLVFLKKEFKNYFRSDDNVLSTFMYLLILPILVYCLNRIFFSLNISKTGEILIVCINILISITLLTASNISSASSLSREGNEFYLLKVSPVDTKLICLAKMVLNLLLSTIAIVGVGFSLGFSYMLTIPDIIIICVILFLVNLGHICWSFEFDILDPKIAQYSAGEEILNDNSNVRKSITIGLLIAVIFTLLSFFFYSKYNEGMVIGPIRVIFIALAFCLIRIYLFITKLRVYFNEMSM